MYRTLALLLMILVASGALARGNGGHERAAPPHDRRPAAVFERPGPDAIQQVPRVSVDARQAAAAVKQRYAATILSIRLVENSGTPVYRVKTLSSDGVVKVVFVDGQSGEVFE